MNFWKKKKTNHHHHHHHRENVSDNISIGREEKRRERERETRASFAIEKKGLDDDDDTSHTSPRIGEREKERKFSNSSHTQKRRGFRALRNGRKTRTLLPPPPGFVVEVVDFRAGFFSTSSSENRFGVGARRALFLSLILLNRKVFFVNVFGLWF